MKIPIFFSNLTSSKAINEIIFFNTVVYIFLAIMGLMVPEQLFDGILKFFAFTPDWGCPWTIVTNGFTHREFFHYFFNMFFLYFLGNIVVDVLSYKNTYIVYLLSVTLGALSLFLIKDYMGNFSLYGASGGVFGLFAVARMYAGDMDVYIFFIKLPLFIMFYIYIGMCIFDIFIGSNVGGNIVHLVGALVGYLYYKYISK